MFKLPIKHTGFTLIEAAVAIAVLLVGLWSVLQFFPFSIKIIGDSQSLTVASNLVVEELESLSTDNYSVIGVGTIEAKHPVSSDTTSYLSKYQRQTVVQLIDSDFNASATDVGLKKITVTVYWRSPVGVNERSITTSTIIADH